MSHTPGPWCTHKKNGRVVVAGAIKVATANATKCPPHAWDNAKLIAASPELKKLIAAIYDGIHRGIGPMASASDAEIGNAINDKMSELFGSEWNQ